MGHSGTAEAILNVFLHSKTPQNFVILSGDVHYSFVYDVNRLRDQGPDVWQICSSGIKNEFPRKLLDVLDIMNRWLYSPSSPLNFFTRRRKDEGRAEKAGRTGSQATTCVVPVLVFWNSTREADPGVSGNCYLMARWLALIE